MKKSFLVLAGCLIACGSQVDPGTPILTNGAVGETQGPPPLSESRDGGETSPIPVLAPVDVRLKNTTASEVRAVVTVSARPTVVRQTVATPPHGETTISAFAMVPVGAGVTLDVQWYARAQTLHVTQSANGTNCAADYERSSPEHNICLSK